MRERERQGGREKKKPQTFREGENLISIVSTSLDAVSNLKQKNHREHKEIGKYHPFKGKNK